MAATPSNKRRSDLGVPVVGEILRGPSGILRTVRAVHRHGDNPRRIYVFFTIRHCSWTKACYTLYNLAELRDMGYSTTGKFRRSWKVVDWKILRDIETHHKRELTCCDVEGIG